MVLPLVPLALIAGGALSGAGGVVLGGRGAADLKNARSSIKASRSRFDDELAIHETVVLETNEMLSAYGAEQERSLVAVVLRMGEFLRRNAQKVQESERLLVDGIDVTVGSVVGAASIDVDAVAWVRGVIGSAAAGTGVSIGITSAVGTYGVASTGAAISGLSGAAAESAGLAFLGGGSLASGGGGMALGATALNAAVAGPAVLVGGFVVKTRGDKAKTQASGARGAGERRHRRAGGAPGEAGSGGPSNRRAARPAAESHAAGRHILGPARGGTLRTGAPRRPLPASLNLVMAVRDVAATPVVDGAGELNDKTDTLTVKYRPMTESDEETDD